MHRIFQRAAAPFKVTTLLLAAYVLLVVYVVATVFTGVGYDPVLTPLGSVLAFAFAIAHGSQRLGWKSTLLLLGVTFAVSLAFESVGVATGSVYGSCHYTDKLGAKFLDLVPWIIPVSWFMMTYPSFIIASRILPLIQTLWTWQLMMVGRSYKNRCLRCGMM